MKNLGLFYIILLLFTTMNLNAIEKHKDLQKVLDTQELNTTFVLYDMQTNKFLVYNQERAKKRYIPASTFKIANSLIGLETTAVQSVDESIPYLGEENPFIPEWKKDMGLRRAIAISNVPIYQELARRVGLKNMKQYLKSFEYGNTKTGGIVDRFWLDGPLKISAIEQVEFLKKLLQERLPLSKKTQKSVKEILLLQSAKDYKLYGKTGWQNAPNSGVGWFVGWLENSSGSYVFALNIDMTHISDAPKRISLTKKCLYGLGLFKDFKEINVKSP